MLLKMRQVSAGKILGAYLMVEGAFTFFGGLMGSIIKLPESKSGRVARGIHQKGR